MSLTVNKSGLNRMMKDFRRESWRRVFDKTVGSRVAYEVWIRVGLITRQRIESQVESHLISNHGH
jgi:hypothetical protein